MLAQKTNSLSENFDIFFEIRDDKDMGCGAAASFSFHDLALPQILVELVAIMRHNQRHGEEFD